IVPGPQPDERLRPAVRLRGHRLSFEECMDLRNWEFSTLGTAIAGADVFVYEASLSHPNPGAIIASTSTNSDGMWAFTGLSDTAKDVKVEYQNKTKWYKGLTRHSVGV